MLIRSLKRVDANQQDPLGAGETTIFFIRNFPAITVKQISIWLLKTYKQVYLMLNLKFL